MKKLLFLLSAAVALISCTNDYDSSCFKKEDPIKSDTISPVKPDTIPVIVAPILLKKLIHTYSNGTASTLEALYEGTKIVSDKDESNLTFYTYTGDVITKMEKADLAGKVYITKEYVYTNGKLNYILSNEFGAYYKTKYIYNLDGSIFYVKLNSDSSGNDGSYTPISGRYTFADGNLVKFQAYNGNYESETTYEYDSKNNPRLNVTGLSALIDMPGVFAVNNVIKKVVKTNADASVLETTYTYEYDANGYPVKSTQTLQNDAKTVETNSFSY